MDFFRNQSQVTLQIDLVDSQGVSVEPTAVSYRVLDQDDVEISAEAVVGTFSAGDTKVAVTTSSLENTLDESETRGMRVVQLLMTLSPGAVITHSYEYFIETDSILEVDFNSYQTYNSALLKVLEMPEMVAWNTASKRERMGALIESYHRLGRLAYELGDDDSQVTDYESKVIFNGEYINDLNNDYTIAELDLIDETFVQMLQKAQIMEAAVILGNDPIEDQRRDGLMSASVGESSNFFRPGKPLELAVSKPAIRYLSGYVRYKRTIGRR